MSIKFILNPSINNQHQTHGYGLLTNSQLHTIKPNGIIEYPQNTQQQYQEINNPLFKGQHQNMNPYLVPHHSFIHQHISRPQFDTRHHVSIQQTNLIHSNNMQQPEIIQQQRTNHQQNVEHNSNGQQLGSNIFHNQKSHKKALVEQVNHNLQ